MQAKKKQGLFSGFLNNGNAYPVLTAVAAGLYPLLFYYTNNYKMINSWGHLGYFVSVFLLFPIAVFFLAHKISGVNLFKKFQPFVLPFLNFFFFFSYLNIALYAGFNWLRTLIIFGVAVLLAFLLRKFFKKIIGFQLILAVIGIFTLAPVVIKQLNYSKEWMAQPDAIEEAVFKKKPNIYFIQPDGYANFSELKKGFYNIPNSEFEYYLKENNFKNYPGFRSNYAATLPTNSAVFMMKHHYYNNGSDFTETIDARNVIVSDNSVLRILKNNGYRTFFLTEQPYFLTNKPKLGYDFCNFSTEEIDFVTTGIGEPKDVIKPFDNYLETYADGPNFFFIEIFNPGHITNTIEDSKGVEGERQHYMESLAEANKKLTQLTKSILEKDPKALIVIMADHGGFVGMTNTGESYTKNTNPDFVNSIFSTILSIHWPNGEAPEFDKELKTSVNLFRILTAYLSEENSYLENLQENGSYIIINSGAPQGVYEYLDDAGSVIFKKLS
ncbi:MULTISPECIES: sulfatase-like hydrolase/transferase [Aequorivita]|uniref:Sulfatase-like hydrolase/transferase n=1 Tax=Aequorivita iocasae TaxID=2803865 RepID=A0ABX7DQU5_9FLAO|nr:MULTISPECIES: sulfatase-like hydrolase/transferase [Aequorivita]QQX75519.1 sulfatase-like hydrolase/transferase [Aequorivita iocasae]UCA54973.1 LTA synthase family protein [Aequorivita sp. F7]